MATENKKAVREAATRLQQKRTEELLAIYAGPMTETEFAAVTRLLKARRVQIPAEHGEVTEDPQAHVQRVITIEELQHAEIGREKRSAGMGPLEWVSVALGILVTIFVWPRSPWVAALMGFGVALGLYGICTFLRRFWREMGTKRGRIEGKDER